MFLYKILLFSNIYAIASKLYIFIYSLNSNIILSIQLTIILSKKYIIMHFLFLLIYKSKIHYLNIFLFYKV
jgi:hypothetical protein